MVQTAPPPKKRRKAPFAVKAIGTLIGAGFGFIGCYIVFAIFLLIGNREASKWGQALSLKYIYPPFVSKHIAEEPAPPPRHSKAPEGLVPGSHPATTPPANTAGSTPPTGQSNAPDNNTATQGGTATQANAAPSGGIPAVPGPPAAGTANNAPPPSAHTTPGSNPNPNDVAQQSPKSGALETTDDPTKTPPPDLAKPDSLSPDLSKPDTPNIAPPKIDTPALPFGETKPPAKTPEKPGEKSTEKPAENPATPTKSDKHAPSPGNPPATPEKPAATPEKPAATPEKPENPAALPSAEKPTEKPAEKPATESPEAKSPIADQLAIVDLALTSSTQAAENLKSAAGGDPKSALRASIANYKAMSHLTTELGAVESAPADPNFAARIVQLQKKAAALAEPMGSAAERGTTAMLADKWIASPSRKENGAVIVGTLVKVEPTDKGFVAHIKLPNDAKEMSFATANKPQAADGSPVVVLALLDASGGGKAVEILPSPDEKTSAVPPTDKPAVQYAERARSASNETMRGPC